MKVNVIRTLEIICDAEESEIFLHGLRAIDRGQVTGVSGQMFETTAKMLRAIEEGYADLAGER